MCIGEASLYDFSHVGIYKFWIQTVECMMNNMWDIYFEYVYGFDLRDVNGMC